MSTTELGKRRVASLEPCPVCGAQEKTGCVSLRNGEPLRSNRIHAMRLGHRSERGNRRRWSPQRETPPPGWADVPPLITEQTRHDLRKGLELARDQFGDRIRRAVADAPPPKLQKKAPPTASSPSIVKLIAGIRRDARDAERWRQYQAALKGGDNEQ